jgi:hypothetical protein
MTQSSTTNDLVKHLYEPKISFSKSLNHEEQMEFVSFENLKQELDQAYLEPSDRSIDKVFEYMRNRIGK